MAINLDLIGRTFDDLVHDYTWRDVVIYALGVGAKADELDYLFEMEGPKVLPTFGVVPSFKALAVAAMKLGVDLMQVVHGEQKLVLHKPIPPNGKLTTTGAVTNIYDKGSGALAVVEAQTVDAGGERVFDNVFSIFVRGAGGFGGERGPAAIAADPPEGGPTFEVAEKTSEEQALLYRLNGDVNPLHAAPKIARMVGFDRPILHGLCTYGYAGRAILKQACSGDPTRFKSFAARFSGVVYPGDTLITRGWRVAPNKYVIRVETDKGTTVLKNSVAEIGA